MALVAATTCNVNSPARGDLVTHFNFMNHFLQGGYALQVVRPLATEGDADLATLAAGWIADQDRDNVMAALVDSRMRRLRSTTSASWTAIRRCSTAAASSTSAFSGCRTGPRLRATPASVRWFDRAVGPDGNAVRREWLSSPAAPRPG